MSKAETKICQNCKKEFVIESEDFDFYQKIKVPSPTWCPECRLIRRFLFRNERFLYKRQCDFCGKGIISILAPEKRYTVYCMEDWWSDKWDPLSYGREYDFSRPFFLQFLDLIRTVPWVSLHNNYPTLVNSEYVNMSGFQKNCYLTSHADHNEDCFYGSGLKFSKNCMDITWVQSSELCYGCFNVVKGYQNIYSVDCEGCYDVYFSKNLVGCNNCIGCVNLRNKSYHIFNTPYSKEEYFEKLKEFDLGSYQNLTQLKEKAHQFWLGFLNKYYHGSHNQNVSGDYIYKSKNSYHSFEMFGTEDCKYCQFLSTKPSRDCYDYTEWGDNTSLIYDSVITGRNVNNIKFARVIEGNCYNIEYSINIADCQNLFGCIALRHKQYCILNKQYSKEEYEKLVPKIVEHMNKMPYIDKKGRVYKYGEFFPPELSPFAYNETAQEYFPLKKEEALAQGYQWKDPEERDIKIDIKTEDLPDHIKDVDDSIIGKVIECQHQGKCNEQCTFAFKLIEPELQFYRRMNLPLPRLCPNCRHYQRLKQRNPLKLWHRKCQCAGAQSLNGVYKNTVEHFHAKEPCPNEFETTYAPDRPEIVYCEKCYLAEVV